MWVDVAWCGLAGCGLAWVVVWVAWFDFSFLVSFVAGVDSFSRLIWSASCFLLC